MRGNVFAKNFRIKFLGFPKKSREVFDAMLCIFCAAPLPRCPPPSHLGAASGPDRTSKWMRNKVSANEQDGAAERSEAAFVAPSPLLVPRKGMVQRSHP